MRNLSFYAKESDVKATLEREFGPVLEIQLPRVNETTHRGFCFVTFANAKDAHACTMPRPQPLMIRQRAVAMDYAISKRVHQQQQEQVKKVNEEDQEEESIQAGGVDDDDKDEDGSGTDAEEENDEEEVDDGDDDSDENQEDDDEKKTTEEKDTTNVRRQAPVVDEGVSRQQTIFMRNLPFDTTRHDVFQLMHKFGHVDSIFLVKDKDTGVFKGTAFVQYKTKEAAARAMEVSSSGGNDEFTSQKEGSASNNNDTGSGGLQLNGRRVYCDFAVDKSTASTLTLEQEEKVTGKDRRNLYLKTEGRVANQADLPGNVDNSAWESLPESDQLKRQNAFMEKNTKLRSPLFFINPKRLSIRNLAKHVDEVQLKKLVVEATIQGLARGLVNQEDQVAHWRASGDMTTREILKRMETSTEPLIPVLDEKNIKASIPSVFIDRDFTTKKSEVGQSRGFGFVDFTHHVHALACLRQLNNNPKYSIEYVTAGKKGNAAAKELASGEAGGGRKAPRLIADFTVENKAKAKKQAEHRAQQQANRDAQKLEHKAKTAAESNNNNKGEVKKKKPSRGALQREKKRKAKDESSIVDVQPVATKVSKTVAPQPAAPTVKLVKPPKKRKLDTEEQTFERLVQSYTESFSSTIQKSNNEEQANIKPKKSAKRWFE